MLRIAPYVLALAVWLLAEPAGAASRTGTPVQVDGSAGNGSVSVTVPADATAVIAFWTQYVADTNEVVTGLTLNGSAFTIQSQLSESSSGAGVGVATLASPATGVQTFAWTYTANNARTEGGFFQLVWVKGVETSNLVRGASTDQDLVGNNVTVSVTTEPGDLLLALGSSFTPTNPALDGTVFLNDQSLNLHIYDVSEIATSAGSTVVNMTNESHSTMAAVSLRTQIIVGCLLNQDGGKLLAQNGTDGVLLQGGASGACISGGGGATVIPARMLLGVGL